MLTLKRISDVGSMRSKLFVCLLSLALLACAEEEDASPIDDQKYIDVTLALLKARSTPIPGPDSTNVRPRLDSVFTSHKLTPEEYRKMSEALASDPERALRLHNVIKDSLGIRR